jgi:hypothetical protein
MLPDDFAGVAPVPVKLTVDFTTRKECARDLGAEVPKPEQGAWSDSCTKSREIRIRPCPWHDPQIVSCNTPFGPVTLKVPPEGGLSTEGGASVEYLLQCPIQSTARFPKGLKLWLEYFFNSLPEQSWVEANWFKGVASVEIKVRLTGDIGTSLGIGEKYLCTLNNYDNRCPIPLILPIQQKTYTEEVELLNPELVESLQWLISHGGYRMLEISIRPLLLVLWNRDASYRPGKAVEVQYSGRLEVQY